MVLTSRPKLQGKGNSKRLHPLRIGSLRSVRLASLGIRLGAHHVLDTCQREHISKLSCIQKVLCGNSSFYLVLIAADESRYGVDLPFNLNGTHSLNNPQTGKVV